MLRRVGYFKYIFKSNNGIQIHNIYLLNLLLFKLIKDNYFNIYFK